LQIKNFNKQTVKKEENSYDCLDLESFENSNDYFTEESYECEISLDGISKSHYFKAKEERNKKQNKENEKVYRFDSSFNLDDEDDNLPFNCTNKEKIRSEHDSDVSEFEFKSIGRKKTFNKKYNLEGDFEWNKDSKNEINFNRITEDYNDESVLEKINPNKKKKENLKQLIVKNDLDKFKFQINQKEYK